MELWVLLGLTLCVIRINGFSLTVTRGYQDLVSIDGLNCRDGDICKCEHGLTYILDKVSLKGRCVRDYEIIQDNSGKFLPRGNKCIGVTDDEKVVDMNCNKHDPSVKWIWTLDDGQMLNLKTLKCLKGESKKLKNSTFDTTFSVEQCDSSVLRQQWECRKKEQLLKNKEAMGFRLKWLMSGKDSYFQNCTENIHSYKGCYHFADGEAMKLINTTGCDTWVNGTCGLQIKIQAPIGARYNPQTCQLIWTESTYSISGLHWLRFSEALHEVQLNTTMHSVTLQIKNRNSLISKWKGHLLRLNIRCRNNEGRSESHCALLKIQGTATEQIPQVIDTSSPTPTTSYITSSTTSATTSATTSPTTSGYQNNKTSTTTSPHPRPSSPETSGPDKTNQDGGDGEESSLVIPLVAAAAGLFCLLLAVVAMVIVCKRQNRKKGDVNQNDEHIYEEATPVDNGPVSPIYMEIDYLSRKKSKKSNSSKKRSKSQSYEEPTENPFYHTLEKPDRVVDDGIYEEVDEIVKTVKPKPFEKELNV